MPSLEKSGPGDDVSCGCLGPPRSISYRHPSLKQRSVPSGALQQEAGAGSARNRRGSLHVPHCHSPGTYGLPLSTDQLPTSNLHPPTASCQAPPLSTKQLTEAAILLINRSQAGARAAGREGGGMAVADVQCGITDRGASLPDAAGRAACATSSLQVCNVAREGGFGAAAGRSGCTSKASPKSSSPLLGGKDFTDEDDASSGGDSEASSLMGDDNMKYSMAEFSNSTEVRIKFKVTHGLRNVEDNKYSEL